MKFLIALIVVVALTLSLSASASAGCSGGRCSVGGCGGARGALRVWYPGKFLLRAVAARPRLFRGGCASCSR